MRAIINSLLLIITFIQKIKSISEFKAIKFDRDKFLIISQEGIYVYDKDLNIKSRYLDPSLHLTAADLKNISFYKDLFNYNQNYIFKFPNQNMITCFSCETLSLSHLNVEKKLTCFFGYVNKIIAYSFRYDSKNENITIYSNKTISSNGAIILKTIL